MGKDRFRMTGSGTDWNLKRKVNQAGKINFRIIALNEDRQPGRTATAALQTYQNRFKANKDGSVTDILTGKTGPRFVDNGNDTVTDRLTSLMWTKSPKQIAVDWNEATDYCRNLQVGDLRGWRLPTIREWRQFTSRKQKNPALPQGHPFVNISTHVGYWSKTRHKFGPAYVYQISLWDGRYNHQKKTENSLVWPVRYAETSGS